MTLSVLKKWLMEGARLALPLLLLALNAISPAPVRAQTGGNQAGLVVVHGDGRVTTLCVAFAEPQISGSDLVFRSGLSLVSTTGPLGLTVCSLDGEGCPSSDCFCECHGTPCVYWNYYTGNADGSWTYANIGAASQQITNGDVDAWLWGESSKLPPSITFVEICDQASRGQAEPVPVSPPAQVTPVPTATPELTETDPPASTETPPAPTEAPAPGAEVTTTSTSSATPKATATAVVKTSRPATASPTSTPSPAAEAQTSSRDGSVVNEEPAPSGSPSTQPGAGLVQGRPGQIVAFVAVLGIVGGTFALLSRRPGGRRSGPE